MQSLLPHMNFINQFNIKSKSFYQYIHIHLTLVYLYVIISIIYTPSIVYYRANDDKNHFKNVHCFAAGNT